MNVTIRRAQEKDLAAVERIYDAIHTEEEAGRACIGWEREIYPTRRTAEDALVRDDLFVEETEGRIVGTAIINRVQVGVYAEVKWLYPALDEQVMVLHTLVIDPDEKGKGYGREFVAFYEEYASRSGCTCLRMDTNARNEGARRLYRHLGYREAGIVPCGDAGEETINTEKEKTDTRHIKRMHETNFAYALFFTQGM